jgi:hypothetical protein
LKGYLDNIYRKRRERLYGTAEQPVLPTDPRLFNEAIGLPVSASTRLPAPLTQYQLDVLNYKGKDLIINKANKIGITEIVLRDMVYRGTVGDCAGYQFLMTSSAKGLAANNMKRLQRIFNNSPLLRPLIKGEPRGYRLDLTNETEYIVLATTQAAGRSWERVKYVFPDEAAHTGMLDDSDFFAALSARRGNTDGYLRMPSTPKGQRGTFWGESMRATAGDSQTKYMVLPYQVGLGTFFTQEFIEKERARLGTLFAQEYECAFLSSQNAAIEAPLIERSTKDYSADAW